jgi:hypothetical protein
MRSGFSKSAAVGTSRRIGMGMTPSDFFESFVEGNYDDCLENPGCVRRAFNAAVAASQMADNYFTFHSRHNPASIAAFPTIGQFVKHISQKTCGAFQDIRSIANAYKHLYTDTNCHSSVDSSGAIASIELQDDSDFPKVEEDCEADTSKVVFTRRDASKLEFLPALDRVVSYWREVIHGGT